CVGLVTGQGVDKVAAEERREVLRAVPRRRDDRATGSGQLVEERAARARRVDEDDLSGRQLSELRVEVRCRDVGTGQVEFRGLAVVAAMTAQDDIHLVLRRRLFGETVERLADFLNRRL